MWYLITLNSVSDCEDIDSLGAGTLAGGSSSESDSSLLELLSFNLPVGAAGGFAGPYMIKCHFTNRQKSHVSIGNFPLTLHAILLLSVWKRPNSGVFTFAGALAVFFSSSESLESSLLLLDFAAAAADVVALAGTTLAAEREVRLC